MTCTSFVLDPASVQLRSLMVLLVGTVTLSLGACAGSDPATEQAADPSTATENVASEQSPELIGGLEALYREIEYPQMAREQGREGRTVLQFVVSPEGKAVEIRVLSSSGTYALDHEAHRVIRQTEWRPGMIDGEPVRVQMTLPVTFGLNR